MEKKLQNQAKEIISETMADGVIIIAMRSNENTDIVIGEAFCSTKADSNYYEQKYLVREALAFATMKNEQATLLGEKKHYAEHLKGCLREIEEIEAVQKQ